MPATKRQLRTCGPVIGEESPRVFAFYDPKAVQRIIEAVGYEPDTLDRNELASDLHGASVGFSIRQYLDERPADDALADKLSEIECAALKFINVLGIDGGRDIADVLPAVWYTLNQHKSDSVEDISEAALSAWHIYQAAKKSRLNDNPDDSAGIAGINTDDIQDSALQYTITRRLPRIYEKHFGKKFGKSIDRGGNPGPGLRFIQAFLTENGYPMEPEAIRRRFYRRRSH